MNGFHYSHNNIYHNIFCRFLNALYFYKSAVKHIIETVILKRSSNVSQDNMEDFVTKAFNYYENADANTSSIGHIEQCLQLIYVNDRDELINNANFANANRSANSKKQNFRKCSNGNRKWRIRKYKQRLRTNICLHFNVCTCV